VFGFAGFAIEATYSRYLGGLAALLERHADADLHFERALTQAEGASARPESARVLAARGRSWVGRDDRRARELFSRARQIAEEVGLQRVLAKLPEESTAASSPPVRPAASARQPSMPTLVQDGETWQLALGGSSVRLKDSRGVGYI